MHYRFDAVLDLLGFEWQQHYFLADAIEQVFVYRLGALFVVAGELLFDVVVEGQVNDDVSVAAISGDAFILGDQAVFCFQTRVSSNRKTSTIRTLDIGFSICILGWYGLAEGPKCLRILCSTGE